MSWTIWPPGLKSLKIQLDLSQNKQILPNWDQTRFEIDNVVWDMHTFKEKLNMLETRVFIFLWGHLSNFSLTAGSDKKSPFLALGGQFPSKFDIMIPKMPLHKGMVVWIPLGPKNGKFLHSTSCQTEYQDHIVHIKGIPIMSLSGQTLGRGNYGFYTHKHQFCNIDSPVFLTQNCHGKIIIIPRNMMCSKQAFQNN